MRYTFKCLTHNATYNLGMAAPTLIYDGDCGFCLRWVGRLKSLTGERVEYASSEQAARRFKQIQPEAFSRAVQLVEADGTVHEGARAVFGALALADWPGPLCLLLYLRLPGFASASEACYGLVAHR